MRFEKLESGGIGYEDSNGVLHGVIYDKENHVLVISSYYDCQNSRMKAFYRTMNNIDEAKEFLREQVVENMMLKG